MWTIDLIDELNELKYESLYERTIENQDTNRLRTFPNPVNQNSMFIQKSSPFCNTHYELKY